MPLGGTAVGPDSLQVTVSKSPNIELEGEELSLTDEAALYHHHHDHQLNDTPPSSQIGRRLACR